MRVSRITAVVKTSLAENRRVVRLSLHNAHIYVTNSFIIDFLTNSAMIMIMMMMMMMTMMMIQ